MDTTQLDQLIAQQQQAVTQQRQIVYALLGQLRAASDRLADALAYWEQLQARLDTLQGLRGALVGSPEVREG